MNIILKFSLKITDSQVILMPLGAKTLSVQMQGGALCLWALVDTSAPVFENRVIEIVGTGHSTQRLASQYIGTVQDGSMVWHVFRKD